MTRSRVALLSVAVLGLGALSAAPARAADDTGPEITATITTLETAISAKDESAAGAAIRKLPALYKGTTDKGIQSKVATTLGKLLRQKNLPGLKKVALESLVATDDGPTAWKGLQGAYPDNDVEDAERFNIEIVKAVGALHPEGAIDLLLETLKKAKQADLAAEAALALGQYHKSKRREFILEEMVKIGKLLKPGQSTTKNVSPEAQAKWSAIAGSLGKGMDSLTGQTIGDPIDWFKKVDEAKKNLKGLFRD